MSEDAKPGSRLQSRTPEEYGEKYQDHLLEQYKLFVQTSQHVSDKRQNANNYLLTLNSSLVTLFVVFLSTFGHHRWNVIVPATGVIVCFIWWSIVESYKHLNAAKFQVIHEIEHQLPVALFRHEWWVCGRLRQMEDESTEGKYIPLTQLERYIPFVFMLLYIVLAAYALFAHVDEKNSNQKQTSPVQHVGAQRG